MNQDTLKQLLTNLSDIESRLQMIEEFNNTSVEDLMKFTGYGTGYVPKCRNTSTYPTLKDCQRKFENMDLLDYQFPPTGLRE